MPEKVGYIVLAIVAVVMIFSSTIFGLEGHKPTSTLSLIFFVLGLGAFGYSLKEIFER